MISILLDIIFIFRECLYYFLYELELLIIIYVLIVLEIIRVNYRIFFWK